MVEGDFFLQIDLELVVFFFGGGQICTVSGDFLVEKGGCLSSVNLA